jgi:nicotinamidase-related amidase
MSNKNFSKTVVLIAISLFVGLSGAQAQKQQTPTLRISSQQREPSNWNDEGGLILTNQIEQWKPSETAFIICDMWDTHWCDISTARFVELAAALNPVVAAARSKGVLIVHSPSECMDFYKDYPQRKTIAKYRDKRIVALANASPLPSEKGMSYPIDAAGGGCENSNNPMKLVWTRQNEAIKIEANDVISDSGEEIGTYFKKKGIKNVILTGVATNMCIMHRSFGLRAMKKMGFNVVLMRDMTDVMYSPKDAPQVNHYSGIDLMVEYIETAVCPSIVSSDFTGKKQFVFKDDTRKRIAFLTAEGEYHANRRLPEFAHELTMKNYRCDFALGVPRMEGPGRHNLENLQILEDADLAVLFIRRRALEPEKMTQIKTYINSGRPVLGLRTSAVAFDTNGNVPSKGGNVTAVTGQVLESLEQWPELDREVWGGNYHGHYEHLDTGTDINIVPGMENHPLLKGVEPFNSLNWLYKCAPLQSPKAQVLLTGSNPGKASEPVLWMNGDKIIYTSLGHWDDWKIESFRNLMFNAVEYLLTPACKEKAPYFEMRGVVLGVYDMQTLNWPQLAYENGINTIGTHVTPRQVAEFIRTKEGQKFIAECKKYGTHVEHQLHAMSDLLPRDLFVTDSTMFRMNKNGRRVNDCNLCVHSHRALDTVAANAVKYARLLPATNHRYYFWIDDSQPMCACPACSQYSESEQALILENRMIKALREFDPQAQLAHLAYLNTLPAPRRVKPAEGVFLEFAPIDRQYKKLLTNEAPDLLQHLKENLEVFPPETTVVLEYWLDVSMFSRWKRPAVKVPWNKAVFQADIDVYAKLGIRNITSFAVMIDDKYVEMYGNDMIFLNEYGIGMKNYNSNNK